MLVGRRFRLDLTPSQAEPCRMFGDICRDVWNTGLEQRRIYRRRGEYINYEKQAGELAEAKREFPWLTEAPSHILQQTLRDLDQACRRHGTWKVRFRSKRRWAPSFRFPAGNLIVVERLAKHWGRVKLPKLGWVRFRWSRPLGGVVRSATVSFDGGHWWVSFLVETGQAPPERHANPDAAVGIDRGVKAAVATSDGDLIGREFTTAGERERRLRLERALARSKKGSNRRQADKQALAKLRDAEKVRREDFCAQTARRLADRYGIVVLEDLRTRNMTRSAKGTVAEPGKNVAQKAGLNRAILEKGWGRLELALVSAARTTGTRVFKVNPAFTSQTCHRCKEVHAGSRESQAVFACVACGHRDHADVNAAKNVLAAGHAVTGRGDLQAQAGLMKRQPSDCVLPERRQRVETGIPAL